MKGRILSTPKKTGRTITLNKKVRRGDGYREENAKGVLRRVSPPIGNLPVSIALYSSRKRIGK
jgi:hypothetical protein